MCPRARNDTVKTGSPNEKGENMATTTVAPTQETVKKSPLVLTPTAVAKVREIMATQDPLPAGLRIGVVGGGWIRYSISKT